MSGGLLFRNVASLLSLRPIAELRSILRVCELKTLSVLNLRTFNAVWLAARARDLGLKRGFPKRGCGDLIFGCCSSFGLFMKVRRIMLGLSLVLFSSGESWYSESTSVKEANGGC